MDLKFTGCHLTTMQCVDSFDIVWRLLRLSLVVKVTQGHQQCNNTQDKKNNTCKTHAPHRNHGYILLIYLTLDLIR